MMMFSTLATLIAGKGMAAGSLVNIAKTPTARSVVGILVERIRCEIRDSVQDENLEFYRCEDTHPSDYLMKSPFGLFCVNTTAITSEAAAQIIFARMFELLSEYELTGRPVLFLADESPGLLMPLLNTSRVTFVKITAHDLLEILLAHPPRGILMRIVRAQTPLSLLNPYVYKGPIGPKMFVDRDEHLEKLCNFNTSYALIGPRAIGKTSLMNRVYEKLRLQGDIAIRVEYAPAMRDQELVTLIFERFIKEYGADPNLLKRVSVPRLARLIDDFAMDYRLKAKSESGKRIYTSRQRRRVMLLIDEADELMKNCPTFTNMLRSLHDFGWARFVLLGYKDLRKIINDVQRSPLMNVAQELPLAGLGMKDCASLVIEHMLKLEIELAHSEKIVEIIYRESGASPSRIQLMCHFLVEALSERNLRLLRPEDAERVILLPSVRGVIARWFTDSTSDMEKWLAGLACQCIPCEEEQLVKLARSDMPEITGQQVRAELQDLITANVLDYRTDGRIGFTFPAMRQLASPLGPPRDQMRDLRRIARQSLRSKVGR